MNGEQGPLPEEFKTCDTCLHGVKQKDGGIICFGAPPTPVVLGTRPARFGAGVEMQLDILRPRLPPGTRACGRHEFAFAGRLQAQQGPTEPIG